MRLSRLIEYPGYLAVTAQKVVVIFTSLALAGMMVIEVFTRYFLGYPIWGWEELAMISVMWLYMIGATMASYEGSHLKTDIMSLWVKNPRSLAVIRALTTLIALAMAGYMAYWSSDLMLWGLKQRQTTPVFKIPWVVAQSSLFVAGVMISVYFLRDLVFRVGDILRPAESSPRGSE